MRAAAPRRTVRDRRGIAAAHCEAAEERGGRAEENGGAAPSAIGRAVSGPTLRAIFPLAVAIVLVVCAARTASEAGRALVGFSELENSMVALSEGGISTAAAEVELIRRAIVRSGGTTFTEADRLTLRSALGRLVGAARRSQQQFASLGEGELAADAGAVADRASGLMAGAPVARTAGALDPAALEGLAVRLDELDARVGMFLGQLGERGARLRAIQRGLELDSFGATRKMFVSLVGAVVSMLILFALHRRAMRDAEFRANHDPLTGLVNRRAFEARISRRNADRGGGPVAVMVVDLDDFKQINDELGHMAGDRVLQAFADRLADSFPADATVLRWGGDEFAVIIPLEGYVGAGAISMLRVAFDRLAAQLMLEPESVGVRCSAGLALYPADGADLPEVLQLADLALFEAKRRGKGRLQFYDRSLSAERQRVIALRGRLRMALAEGELEVHWQPQVDVGRALVPSAEALVRWVDLRSGENISPKDFIPAIESTDLIIELDHFVLDSAIRTAARWGRRWKRPPTVAVNVSAIHFQQREFIGLVSELLHRYGVPPEQLELEITEGVILGQNDDVRRNLDGLARLGVRIALDDFGTGYSNIAYLLQLKPDRLKIDQSFVRNLAGSEQMRQLVAAIIGIGRVIDCEVVAEGVETREQVDALDALGCRLLQGYHFARPMPAPLFEKWRDAEWPEQMAPQPARIIRRAGAGAS